MSLRKILYKFKLKKKVIDNTNKVTHKKSSPYNLPPKETDNNYDEAYSLQRKATEYKKEGRLDLAIECLEKSNNIMMLSPHSYFKKDFSRLIEYLKLDKQFDEARAVEEDLRKKLPYFFDGKTIKNSQLEEIKSNLITFHGSSICPLCSIYNQRTYSKQGKDKRFPSFSLFPENLKVVNCPECGCYIGFGEGDDFDYNGSLAESIKNSNRPFIDTRTNEQKSSYEQHKIEKIQQEKDKQDYDWLCEYLPKLAPKSFSGYRRMKNTKSKNYLKIVEAALENGRTI